MLSMLSMLKPVAHSVKGWMGDVFWTGLGCLGEAMHYVYERAMLSIPIKAKEFPQEVC